MKDIDIHITARRLRIELWLFAACVAIGMGLNIYAITEYNAPWSELLTSMFYVLAFALVLYATTAVVRLVVHLLFRRRKNSKS